MKCQKEGQPHYSDRMLVQPILPLVPFQKWGLDFVGPIKEQIYFGGGYRLLYKVGGSSSIKEQFFQVSG